MSHHTENLFEPERIRFKDVDDFAEIFDSFTWNKEQAPVDTVIGKRNGRVGRITTYISMPDHKAGYVTLAPDKLASFHDALFQDLTLSFKAITHKDTGYTLLTMDYSEIIGGYWLAYVRTDTLPEAEA